ncbi:DUF732 domain-containing protein [Pseudarthrobacter chlorophenolicus]|nr:DUF732 domain-containing protein [Pseudarthrobacter chlorophenolicus]
MKKLATLSLAAAAIAMTAGCSILPQAAPSPTVTVTAESTPSAPARAEAGLDSTAGRSETSNGSTDTEGSTDTTSSKTMWDYQDGKVSDQSFVAHIRENTTTLAPYDDDMMIVLAQNICADVANGTTKSEIVEHQESLANSVQTGELTKEMGRDVAYLVVTGAENYCPALSDELMDILRS